MFLLRIRRPRFSSRLAVVGRLTRSGLFTILATTAMTAIAAEKPTFHWSDQPAAGVLDLKYGSAPVLRYMYAFDNSTPEKFHETYKVYHHVFGPGSDRLITKGPGGQYTHHRGLYFAYNQTKAADGVFDFWHCRDGVSQRHVEFTELKADKDSASMTSRIDWADKDGKPVIIESRTVTVRPIQLSDNAPASAWQIDWSSTITSQRGDITLTGDRQHAGFQFRADNAVAEANSARYIRPAKAPQQAEAFQVPKGEQPPRHVDLDWLAMTYELDGKRYTIEYFEAPSLPSPSRYSERPYGRFGAFIQHELKGDTPWTLRYRVIVSTGESPSQEQIQKRYDQFAKDLQAIQPAS